MKMAKWLIVGAACLSATALAAQQPASTATTQSPATSGAATVPLNAPIPFDSQVTTGQFSNGLRYYIRKNKKPEQRAELRLVVNAGSILEETDQRGLAHFVEHMAFNGTKHFPKQETVKFLESIGMRFGPSVNAFTSFDETVYMLEVPTDKPDVLDKAFLILEDWAHNVSFDAAEIDKERGVITEEWRLRRGAGARMQDKQFPILFKGSRYAERLPIGDMEVVQSFKHERLKKFYEDWYRPELMAVVAVGDFDKAAIETLIKNHFETIPKSPATKLRPAYNVPEQPGTLYAIATDKEASGTSVAVYSKMPAREQTTVGAYRQGIVERLFAGMLSTRFSEMAQKPDAPFLGAGAGRGQFVRSLEVSTLSAGVKEDGVERGLDALFTEALRVEKFGFTATELDRIKTNIMRGLERAVTEKENTPSASLADEYVRNFTEKEPSPGIDYEMGLHARFLPQITLAEVNALAKQWAPDKNRVVMVNAPEKAGLTIPDETKLAGVISSATGKTLTAYVDTVGTQPLMENAPARGEIAKTTTKESFGITEWELSNGVKVGAEADDVQRGRDPVPGVQPWRHLAGTGQRLHFGTNRGTGHCQRRCWQVQLGRASQNVDRQSGVCPAVHRRTRGRNTRKRIEEGSRNDVSVDLPVVHAASRRCRYFQGHDDDDQVAARQPKEHARVCVCQRAEFHPQPGPSACAVDDARDGRPDESGQVPRVLQGPLQRRKRLYVRIHREFRSRHDETAGDSVSGGSSCHAPEGNVEGCRHQETDRRDRETRRERA
jgi:predicted Zn-dependent peptidase